MKRALSIRIHLLALVTLCFLLLATDADAQRKKRKEQLATVIQTAKGYLGTPYLYGGTTRKGIDCSGLIYTSYKAAGITLPRTAEAQAKAGKARGWEELREGDIVLFKFKDDGEKWWHSGMITYVKGEQIKFIHASSSRGVVESDLMNDYYRKNVKRFRRVIK
ncbi:MAG: C40 family peptidase [Cyclobacteriaceae bacterium]|nr:C40 family peptidase [Cyclobacteriaceae bacterium]